MNYTKTSEINTDQPISVQPVKTWKVDIAKDEIYFFGDNVSLGMKLEHLLLSISEAVKKNKEEQ